MNPKFKYLFAILVSLILMVSLTASVSVVRAEAPPKVTGCITPPTGILSWWSGDGHPFDLVGNNDGILLQGATYADGMVGLGFSFDGVDDYVSIPNSTSLQALGDTFSIEAWVYPENLPTGDQYYDLGIVVREDYASGFALATKGNAFGLWIGSGSGYGLIASGDPVTSHQWYHVVGTFDGAIARIYVNGALEGTQAATILHYDTPLTIGSSHGNERFFPGQVDEVTLYDRTLTDEEVQTLYGGCNQLPEGVALYWPFDEGIGTGTDDIIGENDGTLVGATWAAGKVGGALNFDGIDDYVDIPDAASTLLRNEAGTISVWVNPTTIGDNDQIVAFGNTDICAGSTIGLGIWNNVRPWHCYAGWDWDSTTSVSAGVWTHLAYTWDDTAEYIYKNGQFTESRPRNFNYLIGHARIGNGWWGDPANAFPGLLDELMVFDRTLSAVEVQSLYNGSLVPPTDAAARWPFEEGTGLTTEDVIGSNDGTLNGPTWSYGRQGLALSFDGANDYISTPDSDLWDLASADFTVAGWVNTTTPGATMRLFSAGSSGDGPNNMWAFGYGAHSYWGTGNRMNLAYWDGSAYIDINSDEFELVPGTWNYLALVRSGTSLSFYFNGVLTGNRDIGTIVLNGGSTGAAIGARYNANTASIIEYAQGLIDEVVFYQRALGMEEITALYNIDCPGKCKPCFALPENMVSWWPFHEGEGTTTEDILGGNDGAISGATWSAGKVGSALNFDGISSYVSTPDSDFWDLGSEDFTIDGWINTSTPAATMRLLSAGTEADGANQLWAFGYGSNALWGLGNRLNFSYYPGTTSNVDLNSNEIVIQPGVWNHIAVVRSGSDIHFYYNGQQVGSQAIGSVSLGGGTSGAMIGARRYTDLNAVWEYANGLIDEVQLTSRALSPEEIAAIYSADCAGICMPEQIDPIVISILRADPNPTAAESVDFTVTFSEDVVGVDVNDFSLFTTGSISGAEVTDVSGAGAVYTVSISIASGTGGLRLDIPGIATIADLAGNALNGLPYESGEVYTILYKGFLPIVMKHTP